MTDPGSLRFSQGLTAEQAEKLQKQFGKNELAPQKKQSFFMKALHIVGEPMFLLLIIAAVIYFILGEPRDGAIMLIFVVGVIGIDVMQEWKTDKTLNALKDLSAPHVKVIRDGKEQVIESCNLVPGDLMMIAEGVKIPADGTIVRANDLCVDESSLTGEAEGVWKITAGGTVAGSDYWRKDYCYAGTLVTQGSAAVCVEKIGAATEYGKIGAHVAAAPDTPTPLQKQTGSLVKMCSVIAAVFFALVGVITYFNLPDHTFTARLIESVLSGITLAMAMIPEEFPVILTVFLSMGAWRLAKKKSLVRKLPSVETLGAVSVLCVDKTGTITMNQMTVRDTWAPDGDIGNLCEIMGLGCETDAYDPMEKAMLAHCEALGISREHLFGGELIAEYAFTNELKMMGHVWRHDGAILIAAKGSPERILTLCALSDAERGQAEDKIAEMSEQGLRVIAVGVMRPSGEADIPSSITGCTLTLCGLVGLADPPRESVKEDIKRCTRAGVRVVMITGDNGITASSIARQIGMPDCDHIITGEELNAMSDDELRERVRSVSIFSRVVPEHKMRIVKAFKDNGEIVAMTGDGVNDAPALKYADIGIAMGKRGSEVSREAADLILMDDNFSTIVDTIRDGRRIYDNIRKAVGYVFTIHIPIAFSALLAPLLGINPAALLLLPLHVVLLELIIDPTCSIVLERQPAERNIMERRPRNPDEKILTAGILFKSILQGLLVFAASFGTYLLLLQQSSGNAPLARTMGLAIIMFANLFLVQVNSSDYDFAFQSVARLAHDKVMWAISLGTVAGLLVILYTPLCGFLKLAPLSAGRFFLAAGIGAAAVLWYEAVKLVRFLHNRKR
ncbi:cation-translocating P-type ATPase [Caproiciproducens sp.]|uniref:cation-translocating P-type ATPase n=1 Tax=Caproiciproducens sp. TaxID=1954376 RepID=UPI0028995F37|nr:cation-translocating P-type ATPase [Caproiciproducens sp.]